MTARLVWGRRSRAAVASVAVAAAVAAVGMIAAAGGPEPAKTPVAVFPVRVDYEVERRDEAGAVFDSLLAAELRARGIEFLDAAATERVRESAVDSVGGFYDPYTGRPIDSLQVRTADLTQTLLIREHGVRRVVIPRLVVHGVRFSGREAKWYGAVEPTGGRGGLEGFLFGKHYGDIHAITFLVQVYDSAGHRLSSGAGGVQLFERIGGVPGGQGSRVPRDSLFLDQARNGAAVRRAVDSVEAALRVEAGGESTQAHGKEEVRDRSRAAGLPEMGSGGPSRPRLRPGPPAHLPDVAAPE